MLSIVVYIYMLQLEYTTNVVVLVSDRSWVPFSISIPISCQSSVTFREAKYYLSQLEYRDIIVRIRKAESLLLSN